MPYWKLPFALRHAAHLIRLSNQSGTLLLMFPSLWALILASKGTPDPKLVVIFILGAFCMRSAGVVLNDLADRKIDREVARTRHRPLASGALSVRQGLSVLIIFLACAGGLLWFLPPLAVALSPVAVGLAALYPFAKRFFHVPQFILGLAFGWGTIMAWAAVRNTLDPQAWLLYAATVCWAIAYDTIYALQDREDDVRIGVKSFAIFLGPKTWVGVGVSSLAAIMFLSISGWIANLNGFFYTVLTGIAAYLSYQSWQLRKPLDAHTAFRMFKEHTWVGMAVLVGLWGGTVI